MLTSNDAQETVDEPMERYRVENALCRETGVEIHRLIISVSISGTEDQADSGETG